MTRMVDGDASPTPQTDFLGTQLSAADLERTVADVETHPEAEVHPAIS
jgi:hypothetical protein